MPKSLSEKARALLKAPNFVSLATLMPDGSPQVTPVWGDVEGDTVVINTAAGRLKANNAIRDPRVALTVFDSQNPYRMVAIRGKVVQATEEGADAHIDMLAKKYLNQDTYPFRAPGERRLILRIEPERVLEYGMD